MSIKFPTTPMSEGGPRLSREWVQWLQNPQILSLFIAETLGITSGGTGTSQVPTDGQILIGDEGGYILSNLTGIGITVTNIPGEVIVSLKDTGVIAGTYGSSTQAIHATFNSQGQALSVTNVNIAFNSSLLVGTTTNDNAAAGIVGEYISSTVTSGAPVSLTTTVTANVTHVSLTGGDWDVTGNVDYNPGATISVSQFLQGSSTVSATLGAQDSYTNKVQPSFAPMNVFSETLPVVRYSLAAAANVFLIVRAAFSGGTAGNHWGTSWSTHWGNSWTGSGAAPMTAFGTLRARRVR